MKENIFELTNEELKAIATSLQLKIEEGLKKDGQEILDLPTHINPKEDIPDGKVLALDWGGTNFRAAIVEFKGKEASVIESKNIKLSSKETTGFNQSKLFGAMAGLISQLKNLDKTVTQIGYCFSYPAKPELDGDATLLRWTKGIDIPDMIGQPIGKNLVEFLNNYKGIEANFKEVKVINDTVACLFAGLTRIVSGTGYIGLIVGTGTNMAALMHLDKIEKLGNKTTGLIPVNLESGNFCPPYLTTIDRLVDAISNNKGSQRFEKAISGGYLGEIFKTVFSCHKIKYDFDARDLTTIINHPDESPEEYVSVARWIYVRSAHLVAASIIGLAQVLVAHDPTVKNILLTADGSLYWSDDYNELVAAKMKELMPEVKITIGKEMAEPNLIGSAIAALS